MLSRFSGMTNCINRSAIAAKFSSEMNGKLSAKYKFDIADNFNYIISTKQNGGSKEQSEENEIG